MDRYRVEGMTCAACSAHVDKAVRKLPFIEDVQVDLLGGSMRVQTRDGAAHTQEIESAVDKAGYHAVSDRPDKAAQPVKTEKEPMRVRFWTSFVFLVPLMLIGMGQMLGLPMPAFLRMGEYPLTNALIQLMLATPVLFINRKYFISGFKLLIRRAPNMDSLIAVGSGAAYAYGVIILLQMTMAQGAQVHELAKNLYFESAVMILTLVTLGRSLEARAKGRTTDAIKKLMALAPDTVSVVRDGQESVIPIAQVRAGDVLRIRPGERIPVDGILLDGDISVDQSHITGESLPADKHKGDTLVAGSLNPAFTFLMEATRVGEDTTLQKIIRLVSEAGASKAPIARLADRISGVFVPIVMGIALITFAVWMIAGEGFSFALSMAITVLVISCPCALGLATPVAIMVGTGVGALHGLLFRNGEALETLHRVKDIVFDKTGTLTEGRMTVHTVVPAENVTEQELLQTAVSLEAGSEHPLAKAVVAYGMKTGINPSAIKDFKAAAGFGLSAELGGEAAFAGKPEWMEQNGVSLAAYRDQLTAIGSQGVSVLCFARGGQLLGFIGIADTIKPDAAQTMQMLKALRVKPWLLTGDRKEAAQTIARQAGIDDVIAEVLPADKAGQVAALQSGGSAVAMVGDGINDAPALKQADVGLAMGTGTDIAMETADVILNSRGLKNVPDAICLSRAVIRNIKQNLFWAFFYNVIGIPVAAGLLYPFFGIALSPMIAAAAMSLSSVTVVTNALRLKRFRAEEKKEKVMRQVTMHIEGMSCNHCKMAVEKALLEVPGVSKAQVDLEKKTAEVSAHDAVSDELLTSAVELAGYTVRGVS
ncbi:MAG: heavy metal translocating P-type ATPase [Clostridiales bacterium]|nr:heavy metal translocating P-type ATPase [Clostridiales bacterium]